MIDSKITHNAPPSGLFLYWFGRLWMWFFGWNVVGQLPASGKFVLIAAPHTSNWDLVFLIASGFIFRVKISWLGKDAIFKKPFGTIMRWLGGIPVNRRAKHGLVDQIVEKFKKSEKLVIVVPPSGIRKKSNYWKSGFYWIARNAQIPLLCGYLDYSRKEACLALSFVPTEDITSDMDRLRKFYKDIKAKYPEQTSTVRLKEEDVTDNLDSAQVSKKASGKKDSGKKIKK